MCSTDGWRARANTKSGAYNIDCARGVWGYTPPGNFTISHVCSGDFCGSFLCIRTVNTHVPVQLLSSFSGFRSKSMTYRALASDCAIVT